jgi:hypothetical protein
MPNGIKPKNYSISSTPNCVKLELRKKEIMYNETYLYLLVVYLMSLSADYTVQHGIWYLSSGNQEASWI